MLRGITSSTRRLSPRPLTGAFMRPAHGLFLAVTVVLALALPPRSEAAGGFGSNGPVTLADIAEKLAPGVVNISTEQKGRGPSIPAPQGPDGAPLEDFFDDLPNRGPGEDGQRASSLGSGFVIDPSGYVVTNNHVIEGADDIYVNFTDGSRLKVVEIVGKDIKVDLALLRVQPPKPLTAVGFGDSGKMRVGDWVIAIGNPFGLGGSVSAGILSATRRDINAGPYDDFLQTDAAINRGNSGGPLFNVKGEVIGVNTAIISPTGGSIGIGFALPSNTVRQVVDQLRRFGETRRGWLGVRIQTVPPEIAAGLGLAASGSAFIANVTPGGPASKAGLKVGDIILSYDGRDVGQMRSLPKLVAQTEVGKQVELSIWRQGQKRTVSVKVGMLDEGAAPVTRVRKTETPPIQQEFMMGLALAPMNEELRSRYGIDRSVNGVVVTNVAPDSAAEERSIRPGNVILEVTNEKVRTPQDITRRVQELKDLKRKSALLLVADGGGSMNYVAVPITSRVSR